MNYPKRYRAVEFCRGAWHIEGPNGVVYDDEPHGKDKPVIWHDEDEVLEAVKRMNTFLEEENKKECPECKADLVEVNIGDGTIDVYCEECGYPDEIRPITRINHPSKEKPMVKKPRNLAVE